MYVKCMSLFLPLQPSKKRVPHKRIAGTSELKPPCKTIHWSQLLVTLLRVEKDDRIIVKKRKSEQPSFPVDVTSGRALNKRFFSTKVKKAVWISVECKKNGR